MFTRAVVLTLVTWAAFARADSPLTSTDFATAYPELLAVQRAKQGDAAAAYAFLAGTASNDQKLAVANALGWSGDFATGFFQALAAQRDLKPEQLEVKDLDASQLFVAGYLVAMADYLELEPLEPGAKGVRGKSGQFLLERAAAQLKEDFTVQYTLALVKAQKAMSGPWCEVFRIPNEVVARFPPTQRNLRAGALESAQGYLQGYEESCPGSKAAGRAEVEAFNQAYSLSKLGEQLVVGTQGGVVVWDVPGGQGALEAARLHLPRPHLEERGVAGLRSRGGEVGRHHLHPVPPALEEGLLRSTTSRCWAPGGSSGFAWARRPSSSTRPPSAFRR